MYYSFCNHAGLTEVIRISCMIALLVGSELHEKAVVPSDTPIIEAMVSSAVSSVSKSQRHLSCQY